MSEDKANSIEVITREDEHVSRGSRHFSDKIDLVTSTIDVEKLKQNFARFVSELQSIVDAKIDEASLFQLDQVLFSAEIGASGDFKLLGTGIGIQGSSSITFVLQRKESAK